MTTKSIARLLPLALAVCLASAPAGGQETNEVKKAGSFTLGGQGGSDLDVSSKLQQFENVPNGVVVPNAFYTWKKGDRFLDVKGSFFGKTPASTAYCMFQLGLL